MDQHADVIKKLSLIFDQAPHDVISHIVLQTQGNIDASVAHLIEMDFKPNPDANDQIENNERKENIQGIREMFSNLTVSHIGRAYDFHNGNVNEVVTRLLSEAEEDEEEEEIEQVIESPSNNNKPNQYTYENFLQEQRERNKAWLHVNNEFIINMRERLNDLVDKREKLESMRSEVKPKEEIIDRLRQDNDIKAKLNKIQNANSYEENLKEYEKLIANQRETIEQIKERLNRKNIVAKESNNKENQNDNVVNKQKEHGESEIEEIERQIHQTQILMAEKLDEAEKFAQEQSNCTIGVKYTKKKISVIWDIKLNINQNDWIGLFRKDAEVENYESKHSINGNAKGHCEFNTPSKPGLYYIRYISSNNEIISTSDNIYIGPRIELETYFDGEKILAKWKLLRGEISNTDWIGLFSVNSYSDNYLYHEKLMNGRCFYDEHNTLQGGVVHLDAAVPPGSYNVRFFPQKSGKIPVLISEPVDIPNRDTLVVKMVRDEKNRVQTINVYYDIYSASTTTSDWIGLYKEGDNTLLSYQYIKPEEPLVVFQAPIDSGSYYCQYHNTFLRNMGYEIKTLLFEIKDTDILVARIDGGFIFVKWDIFSCPQSNSDWIGIYHANEENNRSMIEYKYVNKSKHLLFNLPKEKGLYEIRFFAHKVGKYDCYKKTQILID